MLKTSLRRITFYQLHLQVCALPNIDAMWLDMTVHKAKKLYIEEVASDRMRMAEIAVGHLKNAGVTQLMSQLGEQVR